MGARLTWIAAKGVTVARLCELIGLEPAPQEHIRKFRFSGAGRIQGVDLKSGFGHIAVAEYRSSILIDCLSSVSREYDLIYCELYENGGLSMLSKWVAEKEIWKIEHNQQLGQRHLEIFGTPPEEFHVIRDRLFAEQDAEDEGPAEVNFIFDVPIDLATHLTGYSYSRWFDGVEVDLRKIKISY